VKSLLTRAVARRRARALFDLCAGFVYSQVLLACVRLRLFDMLRVGPLSTDAIARRTGLPAARLLRLLNAALALGLLEKRAAQLWGLGELGAALLGNAGVMRLIEHHGLLYDDLRDPVALLRDPVDGGRLAGYWPYACNPDAARLPAEAVGAYTALMAATQPLVVDEILAAYPLQQHRCVLDVGGGDGSFLQSVAARAPRLRLMLFDLPAVAEQARQRLGGKDLEARVTVCGGDFRRDPLPAGADIATLVRVLHDHDDATALLLLRAVRAALPAGGRLLLAEPMAMQASASAGVAAYFEFYLLAMGQGRLRSPAEIRALIVAAGFTDPRLCRSGRPLHCTVLTAVAASSVQGN
jgi:demethylspheroidene O-methyltransferase